MRRHLAWVGILAAVLTACGSSTAVTEADDPVPAPAGGTTPVHTETAGPVGSAGPDLPDGPPPFRLRFGDQELQLGAYAWCFTNACADGFPQDVPSVGSPEEIRVFVPVDGWDLEANFVAGGERCGRTQSVQPRKGGDGWFVLRPAGFAGRYDVDLFARGTGDMIARFSWTTTDDGPLATPKARLGVIADHDGRPDSYGVELSLSNLASTPRSAAARITVTAAGGRSLTFDVVRADNGCQPEGSVYFDGPDKQGRAAAALGDFPFRYDVEVTLDGTTHRATAAYPADEIAGNEPSVRLDFSPPLPALR